MKTLFLITFVAVILYVVSAAPNKKHHHVHKRAHLKRDAAANDTTATDTDTAEQGTDTDTTSKKPHLPDVFEPFKRSSEQQSSSESNELNPFSREDIFRNKKRKHHGSKKRHHHSKRDGGNQDSTQNDGDGRPRNPLEDLVNKNKEFIDDHNPQNQNDNGGDADQPNASTATV